MTKPWPDEVAARVQAWCQKVSVLGVDVLVDAGLIEKSHFDQASAIIAEELFVRLCMCDFPPVPDSLRKDDTSGT